MSEKRFKIYQDSIRKFESDRIWGVKSETNSLEPYMTFKEAEKCCDLLNEQQKLIEELQVSDEMGWKRAERFEKKCPKELHNKKMYIKRLEYKVQKFKEKNDEQQATIEELRLQEKEKGVPVFVVRDGKNPVALFFNEQRAMYYCQENMAHLTYQQEKWCRVE